MVYVYCVNDKICSFCSFFGLVIAICHRNSHAHTHNHTKEAFHFDSHRRGCQFINYRVWEWAGKKSAPLLNSHMLSACISTSFVSIVSCFQLKVVYLSSKNDIWRAFVYVRVCVVYINSWSFDFSRAHHNKWINGWMDEWLAGWMNGWMDGWLGLHGKIKTNRK